MTAGNIDRVSKPQGGGIFLHNSELFIGKMVNDNNNGIPLVDIFRRASVKSVNTVGGTLLKKAIRNPFISHFLTTDKEARDKTTASFTYEKARILEDIIAGNKESFDARIFNWNYAHPERPVKTEDVNADAQRTFLISKANKSKP